MAIPNNPFLGKAQGPRTQDGIFTPFSRPTYGPFQRETRTSPVMYNTQKQAQLMREVSNPGATLIRSRANALMSQRGGASSSKTSKLNVQDMRNMGREVAATTGTQGTPQRAPSPSGAARAPVAPTATEAAGVVDPNMARLESLIAENSNKNLTMAEREKLVRDLALGLGAPELAGTDIAARFIGESESLRSRRLENAQRESGVVTDEPAREFMDETDQMIQTRLAELQGTPIATPEFEMADDENLKALFDERLALNESEFNALMQRIQQDYARKREETAQMNRDIVGGTTQMIGRAGSFSSISGRGAITREVTAADRRMADLQAEEMSALMMAQNAKTAGDLEALSKFLDAAEKARVERNALAQQSFENEITASEAARQERADEISMASQAVNYLQNLSSDQINELDPAYLQGIESTIGVPSGYFSMFAENLRAAEQAQDAQSQFDATMDILKLAKDIPSGFTFQIGGETYRGLKGGAGKSFMVDNGRGVTSFVTLDEDTGELLNTVQLPIGAVRNVYSGGSRGGSFTSDEKGIPFEYLRFATTASEFMGRPMSELYQSLGLEAPDGDLGTVTEGGALQLAGVLGLTPDFVDPNDAADWTRYLSPQYETVDKIESDGSLLYYRVPKNQPITQDNVSVARIAPEEQKKLGGVFGYLKNLGGAILGMN